MNFNYLVWSTSKPQDQCLNIPQTNCLQTENVNLSKRAHAIDMMAKSEY